MILRRVLAIVITFSFLFGVTNPSMKSTLAITNPSFAQSGKPLPSSSFFTENKGQWDPSILFVGNTSFGKVAFTKDAVYYQMVKAIKVTANEVGNQFEKAPTTFETQLVKLSFVSPQLPKVQGDGLLSHYNNYFIGNDPSKWASYCHNYSKIEYLDVWEGIDLAYFFTPQGLKYEYYVDPQANIQDLQIKVEGAELATLGDSLEISTNLGNIQDANLKVFDQTTLREIPSRFQIQDNIISFTGIPEKRENTIVIDPLVWSTYLGNMMNDNESKIDVDKYGNAYICGGTSDADFPITRDANQKLLPGGFTDIFITKLNSSGNSLIYSTFLGGPREDYATDIKVDDEGNVYVCGYTIEDFPATKGCLQPISNQDWEVFVTKLNTTGSNLIYSTFLGGSRRDKAEGIAIDPNGNAYICGKTNSLDFPTSKDALQKVYKPGLYENDFDTFVTKINEKGTSILYSTYFGSGKTEPSDIAIDSSQNAYICGSTFGELPVTHGVFQPIYNEGGDGFISKINASGTDIIFSTYFGGKVSDLIRGIMVDGSGNATVFGETLSSDFPITTNAYQSKLNGNQDVFLSIFDLTGLLLYSTFFGGSDDEIIARTMALDSLGNICITGSTWSSDFPVTENSYQPKGKGQFDAFVSKFSKNGLKVLYSTYLGGTRNDKSYGIALDTDDNAYICGYTKSVNFPVSDGAFREKISYHDVFVSKFILLPDKESSNLFSRTVIEIFIDGVYAYINDDQFVLDTPPKIIKNRSFVPLRFIAEGLKASVEYEPKDQGIKIIFGSTKITLQINNPEVGIETIVDGKRVFRRITLDVSPFIQKGRTLAPLQIFTEAIQVKVDWDNSIHMLTITAKDKGW